MPNRKLVPRVAATRPGRRQRRRRHSKRGGGGAWWRAVKVAVLIERIRMRRSSPSFRQIALVIVTGGLAILIIRAAARKAKSRPRAAEVTVSPDDAQADSPDDAQTDAPDDAQADSSGDGTPAATERNGTGSERRFTDRVQQEMSRRADAPTQAGGSDSG
jgi:hypothetical protein